MTIFKSTELTGAAVEVLGQLFVSGPTWDGNISSKSGRDELIDLGLSQRVNGWAFLTADGVQTAIEWNADELKRRYNQKWYEKAVRLR